MTDTKSPYYPYSREDDTPAFRLGALEARAARLVRAIETASAYGEVSEAILKEARDVAAAVSVGFKPLTERERKDAARARKRQQKERIDATNRALQWGYQTGGAKVGGEP